MNVLLSSSSKAKFNSSLVFITIGPPHEIGSLRGKAAIRKNLAPLIPDFTTTSSNSDSASDVLLNRIAQAFSSKWVKGTYTDNVPSI